MNKLARANLIMIAVLVVQAVLLFVLPKEGASTAPKSDDASIAGKEPFAGLAAADARAITITSGDGKVVKLEATKTKEGDKDVTSWVLADRDRFPARTADVEKIVDAAKKVRLSRVITKKEKRYGKLNVADGVMHARVQIAGEGGKSLADFRIGEGSFGNFNIRMESDPAVYEAGGASTWEFPTTVTGLVDSAFLDVPPDQVVRVKLTAGAESYEVVKEVPESRPASRPESADTRGTDTAPATRATETKPEPRWVVVADKQVLDKTKVESWIRGLAKVTLSEPIGKEKKGEYGFDKPTSTVVLTTADGKETTIVVGAERKEQHDYYMTATGKDFVVTAASWIATDQFQKKVKDLLPGPSATSDDHSGHDHR
jgi:hypothetical protein